MSRVFEALTRANEEKVREEERKLDATHSGTIAETRLEILSPAGETNLVSNGYAHTSPAAVQSATHSSRSSSWRERLEELCFGWDLRRYATHPIVALEEESTAAEQYKILREQFRRLRTTNGLRSIAITSPVKKDGKTTVAVNLAASISLEYEEKVLLIDADLRAPSVHRYFNIDSSPGLTEYLSSQTPSGMNSLIKATHLTGLRVIPAGKPSRFAAELLAKERMKLLLQEIHTLMPEYTVIVDSPPVLATPDPMVLSRQIDGVIIVVRARKTPKDYLLKAVNALNSAKLLGVVLNGADFGLGSKYYYYSSNGHG